MRMWFLPGTSWIAFLVRVDEALAAFSVPAPRFVEGLCAARDMVGFGAVQREEAPLDELLPWSGNV
jgi:hypothetical protein